MSTVELIRKVHTYKLYDAILSLFKKYYLNSKVVLYFKVISRLTEGQ